MTNLTGQGVYQKATAEQKKLDKEYLAWLRKQPCLLVRLGGCEGIVVSAHVRLGGRGGTGYKPLESAVPLCDGHHKMQSNGGHEQFGNKDWWLDHADGYYRRFIQLVR